MTLTTPSTTSTTPSTLGNEAAIPAAELADAETVFAEGGVDDDIVAWRREYYLVLRTGWNQVARRYQANFVCGHDEAVALVRKHCGCLHQWETTGRFDHTNKVLGTYQRGVDRVCARCGATDRVVTSANNWSGD